MKPTRSNSRHTRTLAIGLSLLTAPMAFADGNDDFNDNTKNPARWGSPIGQSGNGLLTETSQRLQYTCAGPSLADEQSWPWELTRFPYNADWQIIVDAANSTSPTGAQECSMGINIVSPRSGRDYFYHELYNTGLFGAAGRKGFHAHLYDNDNSIGFGDSSDLPGTTGAVRIRWNSATKVFHCDYDTDPSDGYTWIELGSFGVAGSGGTLFNTNWGLTNSDQFFASVYGYSRLMNVTPGQMSLDNFAETGGVVSKGGTRPEPTGNFPFTFPSGDPRLTRIVSITGNYQGISPTAAARNYDIDVAQDESGKVDAMGTIDGITDNKGRSEIGGAIGSIKTVNKEPVAAFKGKFNGSRDGIPVSANGSLSGPVEVQDPLGDPTIGGTAKYKSTVAGVPFSGKNVPVQIPAPTGTEENLNQDWSFQLNLERKVEKGEEQTFASATLVLPSGDTIVFPEQAVKYTDNSGYRINFKKGVNTTRQPNRIDKNTVIQLRNLTFEQQGDTWTPKGGTIIYKFLGQRGIEKLMDFVQP